MQKPYINYIMTICWGLIFSVGNAQEIEYYRYKSGVTSEFVDASSEYYLIISNKNPAMLSISGALLRATSLQSETNWSEVASIVSSNELVSFQVRPGEEPVAQPIELEIIPQFPTYPCVEVDTLVTFVCTGYPINVRYTWFCGTNELEGIHEKEMAFQKSCSGFYWISAHTDSIQAEPIRVLVAHYIQNNSPSTVAVDSLIPFGSPGTTANYDFLNADKCLWWNGAQYQTAFLNDDGWWDPEINNRWCYLNGEGMPRPCASNSLYNVGAGSGVWYYPIICSTN